MDYTRLLTSITNAFAGVKAYCGRLENELSKVNKGRLYIKQVRGAITFYEYLGNRNERYLSRQSSRLYELLRQRYLELLIALINQLISPDNVSTSMIQHSKSDLRKLFDAIQGASLDLQRITLTKEQYKWVKSQYRKKLIQPGTKTRHTMSGVEVRSKSEQLIGNILEFLGIPYRYECQLRINVLPLVKEFEKMLRSKGQLSGSLFYPKGNCCYWNVPEEYQWMNSPGSVWRSFNFRDGYITIYPDFTIKLSNGKLLFIEHEGMADEFRYRCNASERIFLLRQLGVVSDETMICTFECDLKDNDALIKLFSERILPKVYA